MILKLIIKNCIFLLKKQTKITQFFRKEKEFKKEKYKNDDTFKNLNLNSVRYKNNLKTIFIFYLNDTY